MINKISGINSNKNIYKPSFNGYVDKQVIKQINVYTNRICNEMVEKANLSGEVTDIKELVEIKKLGKTIIDRLQTFMKKLHKDTILRFKKYSNNESLELANPISPRNTIAINNKIYNNHQVNYSELGMINIYGIKEKNLSSMNVITDGLESIDTKVLDKFFLTNAIEKLKSRISLETKFGFFTRYSIRRQARKIDAYANEIGLESNEIKNIEDYIAKAKQSLEIKKQNEKILKKLKIN